MKNQIKVLPGTPQAIVRTLKGCERADLVSRSGTQFRVYRPDPWSRQVGFDVDGVYEFRHEIASPWDFDTVLDELYNVYELSSPYDDTDSARDIIESLVMIIFDLDI